jgi:hypothetical protein
MAAHIVVARTTDLNGVTFLGIDMRAHSSQTQLRGGIGGPGAVGNTIVADIDPIWIKVPVFFARIAGKTAMEQRKAVFRFTSKRLDISATVS